MTTQGLLEVGPDPNINLAGDVAWHLEKVTRQRQQPYDRQRQRRVFPFGVLAVGWLFPR